MKSTNPNVASILIKLCKYFNVICSKTINVSHMGQLEKEIVVILYKLEILFPPSFFTIMIHLTVHLATEVKLARPVQYRWMNPVKRYLLTLKKYVHTTRHPECSIVEGYLAKESMTFCSCYLNNVETKLNQPDRNIDSYNGTPNQSTMSEIKLSQAHRYVLFNLNIMEKYRNLHFGILRSPGLNGKRLQTTHSNEFASWLEKYIEAKRKNKLVDPKVYCLSFGSTRILHSYKGYTLNGVKFCTTEISDRLKTQNNEVFLLATM